MPAYQLRNACFTLNNYTDEQVISVKEWCTEYCTYAVIGKEVGKQGTHHLQGYLELRARKSFKVVLNALFKAHIEPRRGTAEQAADYCKKDDADAWQVGEMSKQGARNDIFDAYEAIRSKKRKREVAEDFTLVDAKYHRALDRYRSLVEADDSAEFRKVTVEVYWGKAGSGKTRKAVEENPGAYLINEPATNLWFDGYEGQDVIIIDDFSGWVKFRMLLKLLDGYQMRLPIKGGHTYARWTKVIITSNIEPSGWYLRGMPKELERRIDSVTEM